MRSIFRRLNPRVLLVRDAPFLQELMLNLIYPAVLGSVMYIALQVIVTPLLENGVGTLSGVRISNDIELPSRYKIALLIVTILFYICDYLYSKYTRRFRVLFFVFDCLFLLGLYVTVAALNMFDAAVVATPVVAAAFIVFMLCYFAWDWFERKQPETGDNERRFLFKVLLWEAASAILLTANLIGWPSIAAGDRAMLVLLLFSTAAFICVVRRKKYYYQNPSAA